MQYVVINDRTYDLATHFEEAKMSLTEEGLQFTTIFFCPYDNLAIAEEYGFEGSYALTTKLYV